ncbi:hypothetical protein [Saccharomonospora piscinae]|uniref:hypothetical protein n=1 Tax=Saccharomonospora piscinae TaxID=687388 RepID=UPI001AEC7578|nr:hypothetical protein [Saccharomonospora piscinae]
MPEDGERARPGVDPNSPGNGSPLFAALYGQLAPHPWRDPADDRDAYVYFHERSLALGWLSDVGAPRLWGMNDAGHEHPFADDTSLVTWFQVGLELAGADRPLTTLPTQPFLRCATEATQRLGTLNLSAVQLLLPVRDLAAVLAPEPALSPSLLTAGWFTPGDPRERATVRITLDSGRVPAVPAVAATLREQLDRADQDVFRCGEHSRGDHDPLTTRPPLSDQFWEGPPGHRVTFAGTLSEWSPDALGWLGGFLAELCARNGITTPVLLTASRTA